MHEAFRLVGTSAAGHPFDRQLAADEAIRVSTGAVVPAGTKGVWPQEICAAGGAVVRLLDSALSPSDTFVRCAGSDFVCHDQLLEAGELIGPAAIALAIMAGQGVLSIRRKPNIAIVQTGDELVGDLGSLERHQVPACNGAMVAAMLATVPSTVRLPPIARDRLETLVQTFSRCDDADIIVTIGGASVGDHDLVREALTRWGAVHEFWRVAIKPGKPLLVATRGSQVVLGLPGNPASAFVTAFLFLLPLVRQMTGANDPLPHPVELPLGCDLPVGGSRREFLRARLDKDALRLAGSQHSSAVRALAHSTHLIDRSASAPAAKTGSIVKCYPLL